VTTASGLIGEPGTTSSAPTGPGRPGPQKLHGSLLAKYTVGSIDRSDYGLTDEYSQAAIVFPVSAGDPGSPLPCPLSGRIHCSNRTVGFPLKTVALFRIGQEYLLDFMGISPVCPTAVPRC